MSSTTNHKKRKAGASVGAKEDAKKAKGAKGSDATSTTTTDVESFAVFTLDEIRYQIQALFERVPAIPSNSFYLSPGATGDTEVSTTTATSITVGSNNPLDVLVDQSATREWAAQLQAILEEFNLLVCCVATATYKWGTDRSGAADQNLGLLSGEIASTQDHISSNVSPRLSNVLAPVVDLVIDKTTTTKNNESGEEIKQNHFVQKLVDPDFVQLCHKILARNAPMMRRVVLFNFSKIVKALNDYLKAQKNETQNGRSFAY